MQFKIRHGLDLKIDGAPRQAVDDGPAVSTVALCGADFPGVRPKFLVQPGQAVAQGETVLVDRHRPAITFSAPAAGTVERIDSSRRGGFDYLVIRCGGSDRRPVDQDGDVRRVLLSSGLWPGFTARPYGRIPDPDAQADAILVTAIDTNPLAADPAVVISAARDVFQAGLDILTRLTEGQVFVCQAPGDPLVTEETARVRCARFAGNHPAGLAGTHQARLGLTGRRVWQVGYQMVIAIGHLFHNGHVSTERIISLAGPAAKNPRLVRTVAGADLAELTAGDVPDGAVRMISGPVLSGRSSLYLGFRHDQVCLLPEPPSPRGFFRGAGRPPAPVSALLPTEAYEGLLPKSILPVPLMRALSVGDDDAAARLGATDLLEEDMAPLSCICPSGADYGALLRQSLDRLAGAA